jgi:hypothetical protein
MLYYSRIVAPLIQQRRINIERGRKHLGSVISDRLKQFNEYNGDWPDKPVRLLFGISRD